MARKTAEEISDQIAELHETMLKRSQEEIREDIASTFLEMIKTPGRFADYLSVGTITVGTRRDGTAITQKLHSYLPGVKAEDFEATPDFLRGIRFMCNALRDGDLEL